MFHGKMSLMDAKSLPVYQRQWFIRRTAKELEAISKEADKARR